MPKEIPLPSGTVIHERYRIERLVASGGMGRVYVAYHLQLDQRLALKEVVPENPLDPQQVQQGQYFFLQEGRILASLDQPHFPQIYDAFMDAGRAFLAMEFIEGETLAAVQQLRGPIPEQEVRQWLIQLCDALDYLHHQRPPIIFRDLKPSNIMLQPDGSLKLIDFGIARLFKAGQTQDTTNVITAGYSPPEQFGSGQSDQHSDMYALGKTAWSLLTGLNPANEPGGMFQPRPPSSLVRGVSAQLDALILHMVEVNPSKRPASIAEVRQSLLEITSGQPAITRRKVLIGGGAVLGAALVGTGGVELLRNIASHSLAATTQNKATQTSAPTYNQNGIVCLSLTEALSNSNYVGSTIVLDMHTGHIIWQHQGNVTSMVNGIAYINTNDGLEACQIKNGASLWQVPTSAGPLAVAGDLLYLFAIGTTGNSQMQALHSANGSLA